MASVTNHWHYCSPTGQRRTHHFKVELVVTQGMLVMQVKMATQYCISTGSTITTMLYQNAKKLSWGEGKTTKY